MEYYNNRPITVIIWYVCGLVQFMQKGANTVLSFAGDNVLAFTRPVAQHDGLKFSVGQLHRLYIRPHEQG